MSSFRRNVLTSGVERAVTAALTLAIVPFQVWLLGIEAYGLLSFVTSLQVICNILDLGLAPTIVREMAGDRDPDHAHGARVVQTFAALYWTVAVLLGSGLFASAGWLAEHWLQFEGLSPASVVLAIRLMAVSVLLRWPISLYAGAITGLQRLDLVNAIRISTSLVRLVGGLLVLLATHSLVAYLFWLGGTAALELATCVVVLTRLVPGVSLRPRVSWTIIGKVWHYSAHMNLISMMSVVFVQSDRLIISRFLSVTELGYYSLAYAIASGLSVVPTVLTGALFPQFAQDLSLGKAEQVRRRARVTAQVTMYLVAGGAGLVVVLGRDLLTWIAAASASAAYPPLVLLTVGFVLAAAVAIPYTLSIAGGETRVPLLVNLGAIGVYLPFLCGLVIVWGITGAAAAWVALNGYYLFVMVPLIRRRLPAYHAPPWFARSVTPFLASSLVWIGGAGWLIGTGDTARALAASALGGLLYGVLAAVFVDPGVRADLRRRLWRGVVLRGMPL